MLTAQPMLPLSGCGHRFSGPRGGACVDCDFGVRDRNPNTRPEVYQPFGKAGRRKPGPPARRTLRRDLTSGNAGTRIDWNPDNGK